MNGQLAGRSLSSLPETASLSKGVAGSSFTGISCPKGPLSDSRVAVGGWDTVGDAVGAADVKRVVGTALNSIPLGSRKWNSEEELGFVDEG